MSEGGREGALLPVSQHVRARRSQSRPGTSLQVTAAADAQAATEGKFVTRTWRVGNALMSSREAATAAGAAPADELSFAAAMPAPAPAPVSVAAASQRPKDETHALRVGDALVSTTSPPSRPAARRRRR